MAYKAKTMSEFQCLVIEQILQKFPAIKTIAANLKLTETMKTPAAFIELVDFNEPGLGVSDDALECRFSLCLVERSENKTDDFLALHQAVKLFIEQNTWGTCCTPAKIIGISINKTSPQDKNFKGCYIRFEQTITFAALEIYQEV